MILKGKCLCEKISFEAEDIPGVVFNCHCSRCRKSHGTAFATQVFAQRKTLKFIKGEELLSEYDGESGGLRTFCSSCGSRLMNYSKDTMDYLSICVSALDPEFNLKPTADCFVDDKFSWTKVDEGIQQFAAYPPM
ncbi:MAG: hypothetical protein BM556_06010 [Bacteriovorax sp. MedPE-SWde]|nr:MAG: hypothetical protein BM556_06010 [Bacteriovorax sp. MedPE-SWde]